MGERECSRFTCNIRERGLPAEVRHELARVVVFPPLVRRARRVVPVELDQQMDQVAPHRYGPQNVGKLGEPDQPVRVPGCPVLVDAVGDPVHRVVGLRRLVQEVGNPRGSVVHAPRILIAGGVRAPGGPPGLQNRCAGESWLAGSIPVRLREPKGVRTPGGMRYGWMHARDFTTISSTSLASMSLTCSESLP